MERLRTWFTGLSTSVRLILALGLVAAVFTVFAFAFYVNSVRYDLLFGNLSNDDVRSISRYLDQESIAYRQDSVAKSISVPTDRVAELRLKLAEQGLPSDATIGYELFDQPEAFGVSNFVQQVNRLRALEGELARTITNIDAVTQTRVHLVLPVRETFSRDRQEPSASIILTLSRNNTLSPAQIQSVRHLVASAVERLTPENISIVDSAGNLLARPTDDTLIGGLTPGELRLSYERLLVDKVQTSVGLIVGFDKVRTQISAELDFSETVINEEEFDPDGRVLRSSEEIEENARRVEGRDSIITVENNLPEGAAENDNSLRSLEVTSRSEERLNYEISRTRTNRVIAPGRVERLSVAVLVDGSYQLQPDGQYVYVPRSAQELAEIERLVKSAIGFDETARQDQVEIVNLQFFGDTPVSEEAEPNFYGIPLSELRELIEIVILAIVALVIALVIIRPLLIRAFAGDENADGEQNLLTDESSSGSGLFSTGDHEKSQSEIDVEINDNIIKQVESIVLQYPEESLAVIREWLQDNS